MPRNQDEQLAEKLEAFHEQMILGDKRSEHDAQTSADPEFASAASLLDLIERVRVSDSEADTPAAFSTMGVTFGESSTGAAPTPAQQRIGRFEIKQQLGQGGYGLVFRAYDPQLNRDVALKIPRPEALVTEELRSRFMYEARAAAGLDHPNIVPVYDAGQAGPIYFIASRLVDGVPLSKWLTARQGQISSDTAARLVATLAEAVEHAHRRGVVHRDLKPANVLVEVNQTQQLNVDESHVANSAAITDFGLAKRLNDDSTGTRTGAIVGTPAYMAPEQAKGGSATVGPSADIYALGAILYELLTGRPPFQHDSVIDTIKAIQETEPTPPRQFCSAIPRDLESICLKCLEKSATDRYLAAEDVRIDLNRFVAGEPVLARPVTAISRFAKFARRNKTLVGSTAMVLVTLVAATITSALFGVRASRQRDLADTRLQQSQRDAAITAETNRFLNEDLLAAANPDRSQNSQITMREVLDQAAHRISGRFDGKPLVEAAIRMTMARTYESLEQLDAAETHWQRAIELLDAHAEPDNESRVLCELGIARLLESRGHFDEARSKLEALISVMESRFGVRDARTLNAKSLLARIQVDTGQFESAVALYRELLTDYQRAQGVEAPDTLETMFALSLALNLLNEPDEAISMARQAYQTANAAHGPDHSLTFAAMKSLAEILVQRREARQAEELLDKALVVSRRVYGPEHPSTLSTLYLLSRAYKEQQRWEPAAAALNEVMEIGRRTQGEDHSLTVQAMAGLANLYQRLGRVEDAEPLLRAVLDQRTRALGEMHPNTLLSMNNLAGALTARGDHAGAEVLLRKAHEGMVNAIGPDHPHTMIVLTSLGKSLSKQDKLAEAEAILLEARQQINTVYGEDSLEIARVDSHLAEVYSMREDPASAEPLNRRSLKTMEAALGSEHPIVAQARFNWASTLSELEQFEAAVEQFEIALETYHRVYPEGHVLVDRCVEALETSRAHLRAAP